MTPEEKPKAPRKSRQRLGPAYTLAELMAQCDLSAPTTDEDAEWLNALPAGREVFAHE